MTYFLYQGDASIPHGYRVTIDGNTFYKGGSAVNIQNGRLIDKLSTNPSFINMGDDAGEAAPLVFNAGDKAAFEARVREEVEKRMLSLADDVTDAPEPEPVVNEPPAAKQEDAPEPDFDVEELASMSFGELGELIDSLREQGVEINGDTRSTKGCIAILTAHYKAAA